MKKFKNLFSKKTNLIVAIVALIQCILIIGVASFSWIETISALRIEGEDLNITTGINYEFKHNDDKDSKMIDLSSYFSETSKFSFAQSTSPDGKNFFFPYTLGGTKQYRPGDTTDYNVTYYNIDFNATGKSANFFFESDNIFKFEDERITDVNNNVVSNDDKNAFLDAFRIAVTVGDSISIYSKSGESYTSYNDTTIEPYSFLESTLSQEDGQMPLFSSAPDGVRVNVKIWLEENAISFTEKTQEERKTILDALLGASINIDLKFVSKELEYKQLTFNDYSLATKGYGSDYKLYYINGSDVYEMRTYGTQPSYCTTWITWDDSTNQGAIIPSSTPLKSGKFVFGTKSGSKITSLFTWELSDSGTVSTTYNALSVTKTSASDQQTIGYWSTTEITRVEFVDRTTYASNVKYNPDASQFISAEHLYAVGKERKSGALEDTLIPIKFNYFEESASYIAYIPKAWLKDYSFEYTSNDYYNNNVLVKWTGSNTTQSDEYKFTALGYSGEILYNDLNNTEGIGTWDEVTRISISTELVDSHILTQTDNKLFRVGFKTDTGDTYLYMASDSNNPLEYYAFVPDGAELTFDYATLGADTKTVWDPGTVGNSRAMYYLTGIDRPTGMWNLAVVVDGTIDNIINDTLSYKNDTGASLTYTVENASEQEMIKVDNFRWRTDDLTNETLIKFTWTAYSETKGYVDTVFNYQVDSGIDGIYYLTVTEGGTVVPIKTN